MPIANTNYFLEKEYEKPFMAWREKDDPETSAQLVSAINPILDKALLIHTGSVNPVLKSKAKLIALEGLKKYDPSRSKLQTYLINHLQGIRRLANKHNQILKVPERVIQQQKQLEEYAASLTAEMGREPTDKELSEYLSVPLVRITRLRQYKPAVAEGSYFSEESAGGAGVSPVQNRKGDLWLELVYEDLPPTDQKILEYSFGLHGRKPLSNKEIASKLRITPAAVSQRKAKIQAILDQEDLNPF